MKSKRKTLLNDVWVCRLDLSDARVYHVLEFSLQSSLEVVKRMRNSREVQKISGFVYRSCYGTADVEAIDWRVERAEEREGSWLYKASCDLSWNLNITL